MKLYGRTKKALIETVHICKDENVLKKYLESREKEVVDITMVLYDKEETIQTYVKCECFDKKIETAARMIADVELFIHKIAKYSSLIL